MASCPKCGAAKIKRKKGVMNCKHCGSLSLRDSNATAPSSKLRGVAP